MSDQLVLILVIIGGAIGLLLVGVAIWMMRSEETPTEPKPEAASASTELAEPPPPTETPPIPEVETNPVPVVEPVESAPAPTPPPAAPDPTPPPAPAPTVPSWLNSLTSRNTNAAPPPLAGGEELVRLWRSAAGELIVEVSGKRYRTRQELMDANVEERVASAAHDLGYLLQGPAAAAVSATAVATPAPANGAGTPAKNTPRPVTKVSLEEAAKMEITRPTMDVTKQFRYLRDQQKQPEIQIKTVAEEIDEILQVLILETPLAGRGLKVADSLQGVSFSIDGRNYDSVDLIPDDEARNLIRAAIQKWDHK